MHLTRSKDSVAGGNPCKGLDGETRGRLDTGLGAARPGTTGTRVPASPLSPAGACSGDRRPGPRASPRPRCASSRSRLENSSFIAPAPLSLISLSPSAQCFSPNQLPALVPIPVPAPHFPVILTVQLAPHCTGQVAFSCVLILS